MRKRTWILVAIALAQAAILASCGHTHEWEAATCSKASTCTICGETQGEPLPHTWSDATCTASKTCTVCGQTEGDALGHEVANWTVEEESTCTSEGKRSGVCSRCGENVTESIEKLPHTAGEWETIDVDLSDETITREQKCTVCGATMEFDVSTMSPEEVETQYKALCKTYTYDEIARDPDNYYGMYATFTGEVIQVLEDGNSLQMRVDVTRGKYYYEDTMFVFYERPEGSSRILEDDIIQMWGQLTGTISYESVMGNTITIPSIDVEFVETK